MAKKLMKNKRLLQGCLLLAILLLETLSPVAYATENTRASIKPKHEVVLLIHGLLRTSWSMRPLKTYLQAQGYEVYYYSYPSAKYTIHEHGLHLKHYLDNLLRQRSDIKIHFITHSLGGIISREALFMLSNQQLQHIGCLIMLAPPNQGSRLARLSTKLFPPLGAFIKPLPQLSSDQDSYIHTVPVPQIKIGIIAGRYDAKVPPDLARLAGFEPVIINSTHTFIMSNAQTKALIRNFLLNGSFSKTEPLVLSGNTKARVN